MATAATAAGTAGSGGPAVGQGGGGSGSSLSVGRKKDGGPSAKFWESGETVSQLESVRLWIGKHYKKVSELGPAGPGSVGFPVPLWPFCQISVVINDEIWI